MINIIGKSLITLFALFAMCNYANGEEVITVFTEPSPPYHFIDENGQVVGAAAQKVRDILSHAGYKADLRLYPWARAFKKARRNSQSLIFSIARTPERENLFHFIAPVATFELGFVALSSHNAISITHWDDLTNYSIAVQREDIAYHWLKSLGLKEGREFIACADINCSWELLVKGNVDMIIEDPNLVEPTFRLFGYREVSFTTVAPIPHLSVVGYLAAHSDMEPERIEKIKQSARILGITLPQ